MNSNQTVPRVAFVFTHRIQYFSNLLDELHRRGRIEPVAVYAHDTKAFLDRGFGRRIAWDNRCQTAFAEVLLPGSSRRAHGGFLRSLDKSLSEQLTRLKPDLIHLNGYAQAIQWQAWWWARRHKLPIFLRGDGDTLRQAERRRGPRTWAARVFTRGATHVFFQGKENQKYWFARGARADRVSWLPCVSDTAVFHRSAFASAECRQSFRSARGAGPEDVVFVVSGKLEARKRPSDALAMLDQVRSESVKVWFLGSGGFEEELKARAASLGVAGRVRWWGFCNQTEMPAILQAGDVLLHLSEADPWPYSVLDGAASGLALLLSDRTGSYPDWLESPAAGVIFSCGNIAALGEAASRLVRDRSLLAELRSSARAKSQRYTEEEFCRRFEQAVFSILDPKREPALALATGGNCAPP